MTRVSRRGDDKFTQGEGVVTCAELSMAVTGASSLLNQLL